MREPLTPAEANRRYYATTATTYDESEDCLVNPRQRARLSGALDAALRRLPKREIRALDACGGTGNVAMELHRRGIRSVVVDISPEMLAVWEESAQRAGIEDPETHVAPIEEFLGRDEREWDLITFSSALHHLEDYTAVLLAAKDRLAPGGLVMTIFDPSNGSAMLRRVRRVDSVIWLALKHPRVFRQVAANAVRRRMGDPNAYVGRLAERYAQTGIDDQRLVASLKAAGFEVIEHVRYPDARLGPTRALLRLARRPSYFTLILRA